ncbi:dehydrogenase [Rhodococcoides trifolii]|uniref:Dehydrogenase n=1 Tax=Rhodococcoides trifolii TaxID=908250 RepID=A0A917CVA8_9NOCA|nr:mycofactocin system GMC family oxidoreductase MftG [Rhodococcus trifolii]GGF97157.1 dehydrogenase [Rhodococcus trifolii]
MTRRPDVVVIGGGSAGSVFAARISENPDLRVTLLESGRGFDADWPPELLDASTLPIGPGSEWTDVIDVELTPNRPSSIARGRVLGGSGAVNGAYFVRARPEDFAPWPQSQWSWPQVLAAYRRTETDMDFGGADHGSDGPMPVIRSASPTPITESFETACVRNGFTHVPDLNSHTAGDGFGRVPSNVSEGKRINAALAYLVPARNRTNLEIRTETSVGRILFDGTTVVGVEGRDANGPFVLECDRVVLAAGAVRTPGLLMHSGIGPESELRALGIEVLVDLPGVGRGVRDHPEVAVPYSLPHNSIGGTPLQSVLHHDGLELRPFSSSFDRMIAGLPVSDPSIGVALMNPTSRGDIVVPRDPYEPPRIRYRYLESADDRDALAAGVELARSLLATMGFEPDAPAALTSRLGTSLHLCGSARMGDDDSAVVDERCRVRGVDGLSVVDTSVFASVPSRGPHASALMVAERAAELYRHRL